MASPTNPKCAYLEKIFSEMDSVVVAFSGGVDSTLVAVAAHKILGPKALAVLNVDH